MIGSDESIAEFHINYYIQLTVCILKIKKKMYIKSEHL